MSVEFYVCKNCGSTFPDCGEYVSCEQCFTHWCSNECAEEDGYIKEHCAAHKDLDDGDLMDMYREKHCDYDDCCDCDNYIPDSCKYCREEDFEDDVLLEYALELLGINREELIEKYKNK